MEWWEESPIASAPKGRERVNEFISTYRPLAERVGSEIGVSPDILLAKFGSETGWGKSVIPGTNNLGNIKDPSGRGVFATDNMTKSRDAYRVFETPESFGDYYTAFIKRAYPKAVGAGNDPMAFAQGLKEGVRGSYAEDPEYGPKIARATNMITGGNAPSKANSWWEAAPMADAPKEDSGWWAAAPLADAPTPAAPTQAVQSAAPQVAPQPTVAKASTPEKKKDEPRSILRRVDDFVRGVADTATFGYADELAAKADTAFRGTALDNFLKRNLGISLSQTNAANYEDAVKAQRQRDSEGGVERFAGQVGGALAPTIGVVRAVDGATRKARAGAGALTGAIQGGLYGTGSAEGDLENRLKEGATGAGIGAAVGGVGGLALSALVPTTVRQEANRFVRRAGSDDLAKIDAEVVRDLNDVFQREVRTQGGKQRPSMAIDANAVATRYINEAKDALGKLDPKTVPNLDEIAFEIANKGSTPSRILDQISQTPAGKAVVDAMLKADRVRTLTGQQLSAGGALGAAARIGVEASPAIISATTGIPAYLPRAGMDSITNKLGASVPRAKVIDKLLSPKQVRAAEMVAGDLGASGPTQSLAVLKRMADEARQAQASKAVTTSAPSTLSQLQETTAARKAIGLMGSPRSGAYNTVLSNTGLTNEQALPILRKLSKDLKGTDLGEVATRLRRSQDVPNEGAFFDVQNILRDLQGSPGALSAASSGIRNPVSYKANVEAAQQALKNAAEAAPTKELAQFATKVAGIKAPADKAKAIADRMAKSSDPAEQAFLTQFVEPLTQFGKK